MSAPTTWVTSDAFSDAQMQGVDLLRLPLGARHLDTITLVRSLGGYQLNDQARIAFLSGYQRGSYSRCAQIYTFDRDSGGAYTARACFTWPKLVEIVSPSYTFSGPDITGAAAAFSVTPASKGVLAIYVLWYGQRWNRRVGVGVRHIYPTHVNPGIGFAVGAYFQAVP